MEIKHRMPGTVLAYVRHRGQVTFYCKNICQNQTYARVFFGEVL